MAMIMNRICWFVTLILTGFSFLGDALNGYDCPRDFVLVDQTCYFFSSSPDTWHNAYFNCRDKNSELALVKRKWQDKALRMYLKTGRMGFFDRWIGGIYDWKRKQWVWGSNGQPLKYRGFAKRIRKNLSKANHQWKCLSMNPDFRYRWQPKSCTKTLHYICQTRSYRSITK